MIRGLMAVFTAVLLTLAPSAVARANGDPGAPSVSSPDLSSLQITLTQGNSVDGSAPTDTLNIGVGAGSDTSGSGGGSSGPQTGPVQVCWTGAVYLDQHVQIPGFGLASGPPGNDAVVGIPTWFWADGYAGGIRTPKKLPGTYMTCPDGPYVPGVPQSLTLQLDVWPLSYQWNFADGGPNSQPGGSCGTETVIAGCAPGSLGAPDQPLVNYAYENSSIGGPLDVSLTVDFEVMISLDGTPWQRWPWPQTAHLPLTVRQVQSVLVPVPQP